MTTPLDALAEALRDCRRYVSGAEAPLEVILWCDRGQEFAPILPALRTRLPNLLSFGPYEPVTRTGPALWLRAAAARQVAGITWPEDEPAIIYLPGYGREVLRGAEDCPPDLALLVWFAVAGTFFGQPRQARDWTLRGFLAAQGSPIGLDIPDNKAAREALGRAARQLFAEPIEGLKGRRLDAAALDALLVPDLDADTLRWIDGTLTQETDPERFAAFAALAARQLGFDPRRKSRQDAAARLAQREKRWAKVWDRFEDRDGAYEGVIKLLRDETPRSIFEGCGAYPKINETGEEELRKALLALGSVVPEKASAAVRELEQRHGWRRDTVWARRGEAKLAQALEHLASLLRLRPYRPTMPRRSPRRMSPKAGRLTGQRSGRSTSRGPKPIARRSRQPCTPSIFPGSMRALRPCNNWRPSRRYLPNQLIRQHRPNGPLCCSSMGCAWIWRSSSRRCSEPRARPQRWVTSGPVFRPPQPPANRWSARR